VVEELAEWGARVGAARLLAVDRVQRLVDEQAQRAQDVSPCGRLPIYEPGWNKRCSLEIHSQQHHIWLHHLC
jgi:hypothetical protein